MSSKIILTLFGLALFHMSSAQQNVARCPDKAMHAELVSLDKSFEQQGFQIIQFNTMSMPSGAYLPVQVNMEAGKMYQINFLASEGFHQSQLMVLNKDRKKLVDRKVKKEGGRQMSESFVAPYTGSYVVVVSQKVKGQKEVCGGVSILKAGK